MSFFPLFFDLEGRKILFIGAGKIAHRRIRGLYEAGAEITVIAPEITGEVAELSLIEEDVSSQVHIIQDTYENVKNDIRLIDYFLVCAATGNALLDREIVQDAKDAGVLANAASDKELCDFYFPGIVKDENLIIGVSSGGMNHDKVASACRYMREHLSEMEE